jgi:hypothetical protein
VWKGNLHPDFNGAGHALKLEAELSGYLTRQAAPKVPEQQSGEDWDALVAELRKAGYEVRKMPRVTQ